MSPLQKAALRRELGKLVREVLGIKSNSRRGQVSVMGAYGEVIWVPKSYFEANTPKKPNAAIFLAWQIAQTATHIFAAIKPKPFLRLNRIPSVAFFSAAVLTMLAVSVGASQTQQAKKLAVKKAALTHSARPAMVRHHTRHKVHPIECPPEPTAIVQPTNGRTVRQQANYNKRHHIHCPNCGMAECYFCLRNCGNCHECAHPRVSANNPHANIIAKLHPVGHASSPILPQHAVATRAQPAHSTSPLSPSAPSSLGSVDQPITPSFAMASSNDMPFLTAPDVLSLPTDTSGSSLGTASSNLSVPSSSSNSPLGLTVPFGAVGGALLAANAANNNPLTTQTGHTTSTTTTTQNLSPTSGITSITTGAAAAAPEPGTINLIMFTVMTGIFAAAGIYKKQIKAFAFAPQL